MSIRKMLSPENFVTNRDYMSTFDNSETEDSARILMRYLQVRGKGWEPVSKTELDRWLTDRAGEADQFYFGRLTEYWTGEYSPLLVNGDTITIQDRFICKIASNPNLIKVD